VSQIINVVPKEDYYLDIILDNVTIAYNGAQTGTGKYVSCIIRNANGV